MQNSLGNRHAVGKFCNKMTAPDCKTRPYTSKSKVTPARTSFPLLKTGSLAAHRGDCLMLLGSPPDMIRSFRLRKTHFSTQRQRFIRKGLFLRRGVHPCYSGFQVQGSATPPVGMASFYSLIPYIVIIPDFFPFCKSFLKKSPAIHIFSQAGRKIPLSSPACDLFRTCSGLVPRDYSSRYRISAESICAACARVTVSLGVIRSPVGVRMPTALSE